MCPLLLSQEDFEQFAHKLAVHAYNERPKTAKQVTLPHMELHLKEAILEALPRFYVSMLKYNKAQQQTAKATGSYTFKAKLPQEVLYKTIEKLGLWSPYDPDTGNEFLEA